MQKVEEREAVTLINQGQKLFGILHRPLVEGQVPAVVICPGFAGTKCGKFRLFVKLSEELTKLGIAVLRFDYRGAGDSEGDFHEITINGKISDTLKCLDFLVHDLQIDVNRLGLLGRSLGGAISILAARRFKAIKSLVLWAPVFFSTPWEELWQIFKSRQDSHSLGQQPLNLPENVPNLTFLEEFFKIQIQEELAHLQGVPLLHIQGQHDTVVKLDQAEAYRKARQDNTKTRFINLLNSDHDFSDFAEQKIAIMETCRWYQQTLLT